MREGSLEAPTRHPLDWQSADFWDEAKLEAELERVFDICHGCRRCFNLCDSFPRLFDMVDESPAGELDSVDKQDYAKVADACVIVPTVNANNVTPHSEAFQAVVWHLWVSHPDVKINQTKWESVVAAKP